MGAFVQAGISLELRGTDDFIKDGKKVDELINKMAKSAQNAVGSIEKLANTVSKLDFSKIQSGDVSNISKLGDALQKLGQGSVGLDKFASDAEKLSSGLSKLARGKQQSIALVSSINHRNTPCDLHLTFI